MKELGTRGQEPGNSSEGYAKICICSKDLEMRLRWLGKSQILEFWISIFCVFCRVPDAQIVLPTCFRRVSVGAKSGGQKRDRVFEIKFHARYRISHAFLLSKKTL